MTIKHNSSTFILFLLLLLGCKNQTILAEDRQLARYHLIDSFVKQMEQKLGLAYVGEGGWTPDKMELIKLKFHAYRMATIDEARALELYVIESFLDCINKDVAIQEFLVEQPFAHQNVGIAISFEGKYGFGPYLSNGVRSVVNIPNYRKSTDNVFYDSYDSFNEKFIELLKESYEEAMQRSQATALNFPYSHQETEVESIVNDLLTLYVLSVTRDLQLNCWSIGANINPPIEEIGAKFTIFSHTSSQRKAREVFILTTQRLLRLINSNKKLAAHLQETPFPSSKLKIRIDFVDYKHCEYMDGSITNVVLDNDEILYYHRVPIPEKGVKKEWWDKPTVLLAKESYQEAVEAFEKPKNPFPGFLRNFFTQASGETNEFEGSFQIAKIMGAKN